MGFVFWFLLFFSPIYFAYGFDTISGPPSNEEVIKRIRKYLPDHPIILEAGAYNGKDTIELSTLLPQAKIYTFEPVSELFTQLEKKLVSFSTISLSNYALSDKTGTALMYLSEFRTNPGTVTESSSLLVPTGHHTYAPHVLFANTIEVKTTTIDDWAIKNAISSIDILKLDIQGCELNVLMASPKILSTVKAILTEVEFLEAYEGQPLFEDINRWLESQGFVLECLFKDCYWFGDALFVRKF